MSVTLVHNIGVLATGRFGEEPVRETTLVLAPGRYRVTARLDLAPLPARAVEGRATMRQ